MKSILFTLTIFLVIAAKKFAPEEIQKEPERVQQKSKVLEHDPRCENFAELKTHLHSGKCFYFFEASCCGIRNVVVEDECMENYDDRYAIHRKVD